MSYIETVRQLKAIRRETITGVCEKVAATVQRLVEVEASITSWADEFHRDQSGFRVAKWFQIDLPLPRSTVSAIGLDGPFLSKCERRPEGITKRRISEQVEIQAICGSDFLRLRSEYSLLKVKMSAVENLLNIKKISAGAVISKKHKRAHFLSERNDRVKGMAGEIARLLELLEALDRQAEERIFDFNAIEGGKKRYGSLLARWDLPSRVPARSISGPSGPAIFYISFNRTKRMTRPIADLYEKVHHRKPKEGHPLTRPMIQKSRLGKYYRSYKEAYSNILIIRGRRDKLVQVLQSIDKYMR